MRKNKSRQTLVSMPGLALIMMFFLLSPIVGQAPYLNVATTEFPIRVACVGNSVTYGSTISDRDQFSYPSQLQKMLGDNFKVKNFGRPGATLLKNGHRPYVECEEFDSAVAFQPQIVIIHLGLNDTDPRNWPNYKHEFNRDYSELIHVFQDADLVSKPKVWISNNSPIFSWHRRFVWSSRDYFWQIQEAIYQVAKDNELELIDIHSPLYVRPDQFPDALHPKEAGAEILAQTVYAAITGDNGGLSMPIHYTSNMVLQRDEPLVFSGTADAGELITVSFMSEEKECLSDRQGNWSVTFPQQSAGGPYALDVSTKTEELSFKNILIGEVWLCSGQSNMRFMMKQCSTADVDISLASDDELRFLNLRMFETKGGREFGVDDLARLNAGDYYREASWMSASPESIPEMPAVAYYFAKQLREELGVPVGVVMNPKGGSPTESWISRRTLEFDPQLVYVLNDFYKNEMVMDWCRERAAQNIGSSVANVQQHPFMPTYLFDKCIRPLEGLQMKGVLWYQGESNAHNVMLHEDLFTALVADWRTFFDKEEMPFYFAQLSSLNRDTWPAFRFSQYQLSKSIPNSGMIVTSDVGHPSDVHPKDKKTVGERFALLALSETYNMPVCGVGPEVFSVLSDGERLKVNFINAVDGLSTRGGASLLGFEIAGKDHKFYSAEAKLKKTSVILTSDSVSSPMYVRYAWKPYTEANLENSEGLPCSTFSVKSQLIDN